MNAATRKQIEKIVEARVKDQALELGIAEVFDKIGKGNDPKLDELINKEKSEISRVAVEIIFKKFGMGK